MKRSFERSYGWVRILSTIIAVGIAFQSILSPPAIICASSSSSSIPLHFFVDPNVIDIAAWATEFQRELNFTSPGCSLLLTDFSVVPPPSLTDAADPPVFTSTTPPFSSLFTLFYNDSDAHIVNCLLSFTSPEYPSILMSAPLLASIDYFYGPSYSPTPSPFPCHTVLCAAANVDALFLGDDNGSLYVIDNDPFWIYLPIGIVGALIILIPLLLCLIFRFCIRSRGFDNVSRGGSRAGSGWNTPNPLGMNLKITVDDADANGVVHTNDGPIETEDIEMVEEGNITMDKLNQSTENGTTNVETNQSFEYGDNGAEASPSPKASPKGADTAEPRPEPKRKWSIL